MYFLTNSHIVPFIFDTFLVLKMFKEERGTTKQGYKKKPTKDCKLLQMIIVLLLTTMIFMKPD